MTDNEAVRLFLLHGSPLEPRAYSLTETVTLDAQPCDRYAGAGSWAELPA